jgi:hypothetical protein
MTRTLVERDELQEQVQRARRSPLTASKPLISQSLASTKSCAAKLHVMRYGSHFGAYVMTYRSTVVGSKHLSER